MHQIYLKCSCPASLSKNYESFHFTKVLKNVNIRRMTIFGTRKVSVVSTNTKSLDKEENWSKNIQCSRRNIPLRLTSNHFSVKIHDKLLNRFGHFGKKYVKKCSLNFFRNETSMIHKRNNVWF